MSGGGIFDNNLYLIILLKIWFYTKSFFFIISKDKMLILTLDW